jgi:hypothetical protein
MKPGVRIAFAAAFVGMFALQSRPAFEPVQPEMFALGSSMLNAWADYDNDRDLDLYVGFNGTPNRLYRNDGGTFTDVAAQAGLAAARATRGGAWGDFDADGDQDLLIGFAPGAAGAVLKLFRNDAGVFVDVTDASKIAAPTGAVRQIAWIDFDGDNDLDAFVAFRDRANTLWLNTQGVFAEVAAERGVADSSRSVGAVWFDYDDDGDLDLVVGNMDGDQNAIYANAAGRFTRQSSDLVWGGRATRDSTNGTVRPCAADVDGDGRLDLFFANYGRNGLFLNRGGGRFEDVSAAWAITQEGKYDACAFDDIDNDGRLDLYVNGTVTGGVSYPDFLYRNTGARYDDVTPDNIRALQADHGVQWADFDRDGNVDLALTGVRPDGMHSLLRNRLAGSDVARSLAVLVVDGRDRLTRAGAVVRAFDSDSRRLIATRLVDAGSGYNSQNQMPVHLGLGAARVVDIEVTFPNGKARSVVRINRVEVDRHRAGYLTVRVP